MLPRSFRAVRHSASPRLSIAEGSVDVAAQFLDVRNTEINHCRFQALAAERRLDGPNRYAGLMPARSAGLAETV